MFKIEDRIKELEVNRIALKIQINSLYSNSDIMKMWKEYHNIKQQICDLKGLEDRRNKINKICSKLEMR